MAIPAADSDGDEQVKVTDRRKFDSAGRLRPGVVDKEPPAREAAAEPPPPDPGRQPPSTASASRPQMTPGPVAPAGAPHTTGGVDFQSFVYFLYMTGLHELGVPSEQGGLAKPPDLERARFFIDVLHVLEGKTQGNLDPGERKLLEDVLYNLQMHFVSLGKSGPV